MELVTYGFGCLLSQLATCWSIIHSAGQYLRIFFAKLKVTHTDTWSRRELI
jgi:hypothetical protein